MGTETIMPVQALPAAVPPAAKSGAEEIAAKGPFGADGFTFADFLDIINPLQHIPVVSTLYREFTGDTIDSGSKFAGAALFGGPIGLVGWLVNGFVEQATGKDVGENIVALFKDGEDGTAPTEIAGKAPPEAAFATAAGEAAPSGASRAEPTVPTGPAADAVAEARREAELFAAARRESDRLAAEREHQIASAEQTANAVAPAGGWFAEAMLTALARYNATAELPLKEPAGRTVDVTY